MLRREASLMSGWNPAANQIFLDALEIPPGERQRAFLDQVCGTDAQLRQDVEGLLCAHHEANPIPAEKLVADSRKTTPFNPAAGDFDETTVGPYRLCGLIAEGGMGVVYEAEQEHPVRRTVALKIIKPGTDSREVIARFEIERQTLALMDHPNIASVLDAGSTQWGHPYFVMELVRGTPINTHSDAHRLGIRDRLKLFIQVCHAVQHAHQKGIIHRDLKPSNVMVTMKDGLPVPKVIDFGVAKALDQPLTEQTLRTRFTQMIGTPLYMSPEQASLDCYDVDTRSDIYSLGVMLYELLSGMTPCDSDRLDKANYAEFCRLKTDEEPPLPSTRATTLTAPALKTIAALRSTLPPKLIQSLRGELDWIVMKALDKDRQRRYQTARGLAEDVNRYLDNLPVEAGPPSATYRFRKFVRRHRGLIAAASLIVLTLVLGTVISVWQAIRATNAEHVARQQMVIASNALRAAELANQRATRNRAQALSANGSFLMAVKKYELALQQFQAAIQVDPDSPHLNNNFAWFLANCPDPHFANPQYAVELAQKAVELVPDEGTFWNTLGVSSYRAGSWRKAIDALERSAQLFGDAGVGFNAMFLAMSYWKLGNHAEAERQYDTAVRWMRDSQVADEELMRFWREAAEVLGRTDVDPNVHGAVEPKIREQ
ncbi:MAG: protein kinase domain-containing protein [Pirellulaceae bacterium]